MTAPALAIPDCPGWCDQSCHGFGDDIDTKLLHTQTDVLVAAGDDSHEFLRLGLGRDDDLGKPGPVRIFLENHYISPRQARELAARLVEMADLGEQQ